MKYYIKEHGEGPEDAEEIPGKNSETEPRYFAEYAAEYCHDHHDGWEWGWPIIFTVIDDKGIEHDFDVDREPVPTFHATRKIK